MCSSAWVNWPISCSGWAARSQGASLARGSAHSVLQELERKLGYCAYLEGRGTLSEAGVDEAENVKQFIEEAKGRGTLLDYLVYLKQLAEEQAAQQKAAGRKLLTIRTIHSAKGLEWPVVIIPSCDDGNIPHRKSDNIEEERRLLYVALTRSRRDLYIYHLAPQPSSFLTQAKWQMVIRATTELRSALAKPPATWSGAEMRAVAIAAPQLGLLAYLQDWHKWRAGEEAAMIQAVAALLHAEQAGKIGNGDKKLIARLAEQWDVLAQGKGVAGTSRPATLDAGVVVGLTQKKAAARPPGASSTQSRPAHSPNACAPCVGDL